MNSAKQKKGGLLRHPRVLPLRYALEYAALRIWLLIISCFPVEMNLVTARWFGRIWWWLRPDHQRRAMENLRAALGDRYTEQQLRQIAHDSFTHFAQLYLVELGLAPRLITPWSWTRHVELGELGPALRVLLGGRGAIMLTPHFGNYELLGYTVCRLGIPITAIMRPLDNERINAYLVATRQSGGLALLFKRGAMTEAAAVLDRGEPLCFIADQDAGRKGLFVDFFGRKASTYKSIGLLAMTKRVPVIVGYAARTRRGFHYHIGVEQIIEPQEWEGQADPLYWITQNFSHAMEAAIRRYPEQYLWVHRRWKHRPKEEITPRHAGATG